MKAVFCKSCFSNLAVDSRMKIFLFLKENGASTVNQVVNHVSLSQPTISYHLKNMNDAGLLSKKRIGKEIHYEINELCPNSHKKCSLKKMSFSY